MTIQLYERYAASGEVRLANEVNWRGTTNDNTPYYLEPIIRPDYFHEQTCSYNKYNYFRVRDAGSVAFPEIILVSPYKTEVIGFYENGKGYIEYGGSGFDITSLYNGNLKVGYATLDKDNIHGESAVLVVGSKKYNDTNEYDKVDINSYSFSSRLGKIPIIGKTIGNSYTLIKNAPDKDKKITQIGEVNPCVDLYFIQQDNIVPGFGVGQTTDKLIGKGYVDPVTQEVYKVDMLPAWIASPNSVPPLLARPASFKFTSGPADSGDLTKKSVSSPAATWKDELVSNNRVGRVQLFYNLEVGYNAPINTHDWKLRYAGVGNVHISVPMLPNPNTSYTSIQPVYTGVDLYTPYIVTQLRTLNSNWDDVGNTPQWKIVFKAYLFN